MSEPIERGRGRQQQRVPPHNLQAEASLLGAALCSPDAVDDTLAVGVGATDFYKPSHQHVFAAVAELHAAGAAVDPVTVADVLRREGLLDAVGGPTTLLDLQADTPAISNAASYARIVRETAEARRMLAALAEATEALYAGDGVPSASLLLDRALVPTVPVDPHLDVMAIGDLLTEMDATPPVGWLARPVWPGDAYGVVAAEKKAGKSWAIIDLAVAVAAGTRWMGVFPVEEPGPVLVFFGEGGKRKMTRRLHAVARAHGVDLADLPIRPCFRVPHLTSAAHLAEIRAELAAHPPRLVIVDPLYLAARGANGSQLYEMGAHLEAVQAACQEAGAALVIVHHWNKTGLGKGADRMSGAGPAEWGRVLVNVAVRSRATDPESRATSVLMDWTFEGDEIPETTVRIRRRVWSDDPDDLASRMHYDVEEVSIDEGGEGAEEGADPARGGLSPATRRVLDVLEAATDWLSVRSIGDRLAAEGHPMKSRTIQSSLKALDALGLARPYGRDPGVPYNWRAVGARDRYGDPVVFDEAPEPDDGLVDEPEELQLYDEEPF